VRVCVWGRSGMSFENPIVFPLLTHLIVLSFFLLPNRVLQRVAFDPSAITAIKAFLNAFTKDHLQNELVKEGPRKIYSLLASPETIQRAYSELEDDGRDMWRDDVVDKVYYATMSLGGPEAPAGLKVWFGRAWAQVDAAVTERDQKKKKGGVAGGD
jgi:hypothetical protein